MLIKKQSEVFWNVNQLKIIKIDEEVKYFECHIYSVSDDDNVRGTIYLNSLIDSTSDGK